MSKLRKTIIMVAIIFAIASIIWFRLWLCVPGVIGAVVVAGVALLVGKQGKRLLQERKKQRYWTWELFGDEWDGVSDGLNGGILVLLKRRGFVYSIRFELGSIRSFLWVLLDSKWNL